MRCALLATATLLLVASSQGTMMETATDLFHCIEKGLGWSNCKQYCTTDATFDMQAVDALSGPEGPSYANIKSMAGYAEWMKAIVGSMGKNAMYELNAEGFDEGRSEAMFFATFGGFSQYAYIMHMNGEGKVDGMVKVWNDAYAFAVMTGAI